MSENMDLFRLEGSDASEAGGLIIRKKASDHTFKKPMVSQLGLDKLAERKRRGSSQESRASGEGQSGRPSHAKNESRDRRYRAHEEETPTHTGGVNAEARRKLESRLKRQRLDAQDRMRRDRERSRSSDRRDRTPRFRDEPQTPKIRTRVGRHNRLVETATIVTRDFMYFFILFRIQRLGVIGTTTMTKSRDDPPGTIRLQRFMNQTIIGIVCEVSSLRPTSTIRGTGITEVDPELHPRRRAKRKLCGKRSSAGNSLPLPEIACLQW